MVCNCHEVGGNLCYCVQKDSICTEFQNQIAVRITVNRFSRQPKFFYLSRLYAPNIVISISFTHRAFGARSILKIEKYESFEPKTKRAIAYSAKSLCDFKLIKGLLTLPKNDKTLKRGS